MSPPKPHCFVTVLSKFALSPIDSSNENGDLMDVDNEYGGQGESDGEQSGNSSESHVSLDTDDNEFIDRALHQLGAAKSQLGSAREKINDAGSLVADSKIGDKRLNIRTINRAGEDESTGNAGPSQSTNNAEPSQSTSDANPSTPDQPIDRFETAVNRITETIDNQREAIDTVIEALNNTL